MTSPTISRPDRTSTGSAFTGSTAPAPADDPAVAAHNARVGALAVCMAANRSALVWGDTGEGKTSIIRDIAKKYAMDWTELYPGLHDPADFGGYPVPDKDVGLVRFLPPDWVEKHTQQEGQESKASLLVLEELTSAPASVLFACMRIALESHVGGHKLDPLTRVVALANPPEIAANGTEIPIPLANRFTHIENWELPDTVFAKGLLHGFQAPDIPVPDLSRVEQEVSAAYALGSGFVSAKPGSLRRNRDTYSPETDGFGFPSPRAWKEALRLFGWAKACDAGSAVIETLMVGTVGRSAAIEFIHFAMQADLPDPEDVLADPASYTPDSKRGDLVYAVCAGLVGAVARHNTPERWVACGDVLGRVAQAGCSDIAFVYARDWNGLHAPHRGVVAPPKAAVDGLSPILQELGRISS